MFAEANYPLEPLLPHELDKYLEQGWFRMGQSIFTCAYLQLNENIYRTFWLRVALGELGKNKSLKKLIKLNSQFKTEIREALITQEKEELYQSYKTGIAFEPSETLQTLLYHNTEISIYRTLEIDVYDGDKLIAVGFFDIGNNSAAGITSFYHPAYKNFSLGKYLIYQKMLYCKNLSLEYFYLGYFAPGCKAFDYKLDLAKNALQYFEISTRNWLPISSWDPVTTSMEETNLKLAEVQQHLKLLKINCQLTPNPYFQVNLIKELHGLALFDYIEFIYFFDFDPQAINLVLVYDIRSRNYQLLNCISFGTLEEPLDLSNTFSAHLLKIKEVICSTWNPKDMAQMVLDVLTVLKERRV